MNPVRGYIVTGHVGETSGISNVVFEQNYLRSNTVTVTFTNNTKEVVHVKGPFNFKLIEISPFKTYNKIISGSSGVDGVDYAQLIDNNNTPVTTNGKYIFYNIQEQAIPPSDSDVMIGGLFTKHRKHQTKRKYKIRKTLRKRKHKKT